MEQCTVYIDEAGDLGSHRGTRWFVLSAVIVDKQDEPIIRTKMQFLKTKLNVNCIHMREIKDFYKRAFVVRTANSFPFVFINVISDTDMLDPERLSANIAYNFHCKMLLERISWYLRDTSRIADIVLSSRGTSRDGELIEYIENKLLPFHGNNIYSPAISSVSSKSAGSWNMLQLADICATSTFLAHEKNAWGFRTPCFLNLLRPHLYAHNKNTMGYGLKYHLSNGKESQELIRCDWPCIKEERAPGATTT